MEKLTSMLGIGRHDEEASSTFVNRISSIQTIVYRGSGLKHRDFCHDFLVHHETENFFVGAVMDGCSGGIHSEFASALFGKIFNLLLRTRKQLDNTDPMREPRLIAESLMFDFCIELSRIKQSLALANNELHCTIVLEVYSKRRDKLFVIGFGDGYVHVDGQGYRIENTRYGDTVVDGVVFEGKNKPDYLIDDIDRFMEKYTEWDALWPGFDDTTDYDRAEWVAMEQETRDGFGAWFSDKQPTFEFENLHDFSIATDGIYSFRCGKDDVTDRVIELLLDRKTGYCGTSPETLRKKMNIISFRNKEGEEPHRDKMNAVNDDDLGVIRVVVEKVEA